MSRSVEMDVAQYTELSRWSPKMGDMIFKDGGMFRWCALIIGINNDNAYVKKSGCPHLLFTGDSKEETISISKIKHTRAGSYWVVSNDGIYYV